jgi:hypothetical protein
MLRSIARPVSLVVLSGAPAFPLSRPHPHGIELVQPLDKYGVVLVGANVSEVLPNPTYKRVHRGQPPGLNHPRWVAPHGILPGHVSVH